jgi:hypothetical protein
VWKTIEGHTVERFSDKCKKEMVSKNSQKTSCDKLVSVISKFIDTGHVTTAIPG